MSSPPTVNEFNKWNKNHKLCKKQENLHFQHTAIISKQPLESDDIFPYADSTECKDVSFAKCQNSVVVKLKHILPWSYCILNSIFS